MTPSTPLPPDGYKIETIEAAERIINVQHRRLCSDIEEIQKLRLRITALELPWWKRRRFRRIWSLS